MRPSDVLAHLLIVNFSKTEINSSEGEGWQGFQRKERRLEGEGEMGSNVIRIHQDASNLSKNYQRLNKTLNPRAISDSLFFVPKKNRLCRSFFPAFLSGSRLALAINVSTIQQEPRMPLNPSNFSFLGLKPACYPETPYPLLTMLAYKNNTCFFLDNISRSKQIRTHT